MEAFAPFVGKKLLRVQTTEWEASTLMLVRCDESSPRFPVEAILSGVVEHLHRSGADVDSVLGPWILARLDPPGSRPVLAPALMRLRSLAPDVIVNVWVADSKNATVGYDLRKECCIVSPSIREQMNVSSRLTWGTVVIPRSLATLLSPEGAEGFRVVDA
jgi:hypothetical protein